MLGGSGMPEIARVVLVYEDEVVAEADASPYRLRWEPDSPSGGEVTLQVWAEDVEGNRPAEVTLTLQIQAPGEAPPASAKEAETPSEAFVRWQRPDRTPPPVP